MHSTTATPKTAKAQAAANPPRLVDHPAVPLPIEFDSSAADLISSRAEYIKGLASCAACLTAVEAAGGAYEGNELIATALPSLSYVIMEMADQIAEAGDRLWEQYRQAAAIANGKGLQ
jgi:hypothetical protein